jgi:hypothetical protein
MTEYLEAYTLARQMNAALQGKIVKLGLRGNAPHKFAFYSGSPEDYAAILPSKKVGEADAHGSVIQVVDRRDSERDLHNLSGRDHRLVDSRTVGQLCPLCHTPLEKIQFLGGAAYFCPQCQPERQLASVQP